MIDFIFGHRNGIHIIDLQKTVSYFDEALKFVESSAKEGKTFFLWEQKASIRYY